MHPKLQELVQVAEIGTAGIAATIAAYFLGLYRVDILMVVFFSMTLAGQTLAALLGKASPL